MSLEADEPQLREHPHQPARERRGPRLRPFAAQQRLAGLTARNPQRAQRAVDGGQRVAEIEVPFVDP